MILELRKLRQKDFEFYGYLGLGALSEESLAIIYSIQL